MRTGTGRLSPDMKIAVIGTGHIGGTLGARFSAAGHQVTYGSRSAGSAAPDGSASLSAADAVTGADTVVLAIPGTAVENALAGLGGVLDGTVVVDATNNIGRQPVNSRAVVGAAAPGARYVRAFNTLGWENFAEPLPGADLFFAADPEARPVGEELITAVGLRPVYVGDAAAAGTVDGLLPLWFALVGQRGGNRKLAFRLVE
jgi:8-hydroxy-5-deazaflavin:NADPH oxidoreductase